MELHETVIVNPSMLDVGIKVVTCKEPIGEKWLLYWQVITWLGVDPNLQAVSGKYYMVGKYGGFEQEIKVELTDEALESVSEKWHEIGIKATEELKDRYKHQFFLAVAERM